MRSLVLAGILSGCAGPVVSTVKVTPPEPVAAPVAPAPEPSAGDDPDGDGITGAADRCADAAETVNRFEDEDGCPDSPPAHYLAADEVVYDGEITFVSGRLGPEAGAALDGIASVLKKHPEAGLVEIGVHWVGSSPADALRVTRSRAEVVVAALVDRGIDEARLRPAGYGARCGLKGPREGIRVDVKVVEKGGEATGVTLGCSP